MYAALRLDRTAVVHFGRSRYGYVTGVLGGFYRLIRGKEVGGLTRVEGDEVDGPQAAVVAGLAWGDSGDAQLTLNSVCYHEEGVNAAAIWYRRRYDEGMNCFPVEV